MSKPIVVLMPGKERATLRESGALPVSFFREENNVRLWPHDIDYLKGPEIAETIAERPGDVPVFFGFAPSESASEIDERTAEIVSILDTTMVHVVFLDDADDGGRIEYGHFGSFKSVIDWSRSLIKVLRTRFVGEVNLHQMESVLVVVCRGQQIRITEEECREFEGLIGENPNGAPAEELRPFVSCYFVNRELSIDGGGMDIYASSVWDILVGRLLRAFVLSREQHAADSNSEKTLWMRPGTRVWKTEECYMSGAEDAVRRTTAKVVEQIDEEARGTGGENVLPDPHDDWCPGGEVEVDKSLGWTEEWSRLDAAGFAKDVEVSRARSDKVVKSAEAYFNWRMGKENTDDSEANKVFVAVKDDPGRLFPCLREVEEALQSCGQSGDDLNKFKANVVQMAKTEDRREELVDALAAMAEQFKLTSDHYVGFGNGFFVVAAVVAMCGVTLWQVVTLMGGALSTVLCLLAAAFAGSLAAMVAVVGTHRRVGSAAAESFVETCRDLDVATVSRHNEARKILCDAVKFRMKARRRNVLLRIKGLLARIMDVLAVEMQYRPVQTERLVEQHERQLNDFVRRQRREYLSKTRTDVPTTISLARFSDEESNLRDLWDVQGGEWSFRARWKKFCEECDVRNAGHLPVSVFIPMMRECMDSFARRAREVVLRKVNDSCAPGKKKAVLDWISSSDNVRLYSGKAAVNFHAASLKRQVFVADDLQSDFFNEVRSAGDRTVSTEFFRSSIMRRAEGAPLAFAIHEVPIRLESDVEAHVLSLRQAEDSVQ